MIAYRKILVSAFIFLAFNVFASVNTDTIYIVQRSWHTGIVLKVESIPEDIWPEIVEYKSSEYIDIGWGDEAFYQVPGFDLFLAMQAAFIPSSSVIVTHAVTNPFQCKKYKRVVQRTISKTSFNKLCEFIAQSYKRDEEGKVIPSAIFVESEKFFKGNRKYHLFSTCNNWVAVALKYSGIPIHPFGIITADQLFERLK